MSLPVIEIFDSIDGEGLFSGCLSTFVRLAGCNLRCLYCDTPYAFSTKNAKFMEIREIVDEAKKIGFNRVTITGGEPLIHKDAESLVKELLSNGFLVNIETNGTIDVSHYCTFKNCTITMDVKTPSSGETKGFLTKNLEKLRTSDTLKFVMSERDIEFVKSFLLEYNPQCTVFLSPVFGDCNPVGLVDFLKRISSLEQSHEIAQRCRVQLQLHKIIWSPNTRGV